MSVDTNVKGKNLSPYRRMTLGDRELKVLITPQLSGIASQMKITTKGRVRKGFQVELSSDDPRANACDI